jgi:carboxyl-terminal processing protease
LEAFVRKQHSKLEFLSLLTFMVVAILLASNGFVGRILAADNGESPYSAMEPIGIALKEVSGSYVREVKMAELTQGALIGIMRSLDRNSSFISEEDFRAVREDTSGEFEGIGIKIQMDDDEEHIMVFTPMPHSPAIEAGILPFDLIIKIDGTPVHELYTEDMTGNEKLSVAAKHIRGPKGTSVNLTLWRTDEEGGKEVEVTVKRAKVPLESLKEARLLPNGIGYIQISDFKDTTARDLRRSLVKFLDQGMSALVLDLRWNHGGLLSSSNEVCELFLPKGSLVTYTKSRPGPNGEASKEDMQLKTRRNPVLPAELPVLVLVNEETASSAEIVTGALQFYKRAIIVGEVTFGKGSVQTIIPLLPARKSALRLTTALYYTPAGVTIDHKGILPDVEVVMEREEDIRLVRQRYRSYKDDPAKIHQQNHGSVTGDEVPLAEGETEVEREIFGIIEEHYSKEAAERICAALARERTFELTIEDTQLLRAVEIIQEDSVWENMIKTYHKDISETQTALSQETLDKLGEEERRLLDPNYANSTLVLEGEAPAPTQP